MTQTLEEGMKNQSKCIKIPMAADRLMWVIE
ncbi:Uncharacterised protein [Streptococcus pneumoniae]|nr:Uncharacterised protein [Streptococcus pneumoniae]SND44513.1 Uncharacterised protein [Streptococcus pneumoniae]SNE13939.1 Uncharacterised protein [Streptococcus pneumoniae]SNE92362.1 Uncharacterised protein [Streptococcus pneumoniae]SNF59860.1 Uncharacterised protein [Streptococcus pneumoniae]